MRRDRDGKVTLSAGEIGAYTVCPEAWRLRMVQRVKVEKSASAERGEEEHSRWAADVGEMVFLRRAIILVIGLGVLAVIAYLNFGPGK